ncbi:hypothetical protein [Amycolatopsis sp. H20-H5]|uniref:hypothetical protein n=1 Tax=Amycolatopsis sp. H20-H5 TaxID=3046309 RepID=UPI002DBD74B8|nr:hypothetical protein [Amycolatopsis sp. H20-H5]MEC3978167.1 hypothetical protein [Amycolatopsis sp. H20-H5]
MSGSDLERFAAHADLAPAMRTHGGLVRSREGKALMTQVREKYSEAVIASMELEIARSVAERGMQDTSDLIDRAMALANGNEGKFQELLRIVLQYGNSVGKVQRRLTDPFAL